MKTVDSYFYISVAFLEGKGADTDLPINLLFIILAKNFSTI